MKDNNVCAITFDSHDRLTNECEESTRKNIWNNENKEVLEFLFDNLLDKIR